MMKIIYIVLLIVISDNLYANYRLVSQDVDISIEDEKQENFFQRNFVSPEDGWLDGTYWL